MFPNLRAEMARSGMTVKELSEILGVSYETAKNKIHGRTEFKLAEMNTIRAIFPTYSLEYLFARKGG